MNLPITMLYYCLQDFTWMAFPSWGNSLVFASGASLASTEPYASTIALLGGGVRVLPDIDTISSAEQLGLINAQIGTGERSTVDSLVRPSGAS